MSDFRMAKKFGLDGTEIGTTRIELDEVAYDLSEAEQAKLIEWCLDGICPFCYEEIPMNARVCCTCLGEIVGYHQAQCGCVKVIK